MTTPIIDTDTATTAARDSTPRVGALAGRRSDAVWSCMAARIIGTGRPGVHPKRRRHAEVSEQNDDADGPIWPPRRHYSGEHAGVLAVERRSRHGAWILTAGDVGRFVKFSWTVLKIAC